MTKISIIIPRGVSPKDVSYRAHPPLGAVSVLGEARTKGYEVSLIDSVGEAYVKHFNNGYKEYNIEGDYRKTGLISSDIVKRIVEENPDVIGISCLTIVDRPETKNLVQILKKEFPDKAILVGGPEATSHYKQILGETKYPIEKIEGIDYILRGYGQHSIVQFLEFIEGKKDISDVEGLSYVRNGKVVANGFNKIFNPNNHTIPAFDLYPTIEVDGRDKPMDIYSYVGNTHVGNIRNLLKTNNPVSMGVMFTSYGCPYRCTYCDNDGSFSRYNFENVKKMVDTLNDLFNIEMIDFTDNNFAGNTKESRVTAFQILDYLKQIKRFSFSFSNGLTFESMARNNYELLDKIDKSGNWIHIGLPIETPNDRLLKAVNKPHRLRTVNNVLKYIKESFPNLNREGYFMSGFPEILRDGQKYVALNPKELWETVQFIEQCLKENLLDQANIFTLAPLTEIYYANWRKEHPKRAFETTLFSQVSDLWSYDNNLLIEAKRNVKFLHEKYGKVVCRNC